MPSSKTDNKTEQFSFCRVGGGGAALPGAEVRNIMCTLLFRYNHHVSGLQALERASQCVSPERALRMNVRYFWAFFLNVSFLKE